MGRLLELLKAMNPVCSALARHRRESAVLRGLLCRGVLPAFERLKEAGHARNRR